jgi:hypothetical protein
MCERYNRQSESDVRLAMLNLLNALDRGAFTLEVMADELAQAAVEIGDDVGAEVMLGIARRHRVKALELRGQFAAMKENYTVRFHSSL